MFSINWAIAPHYKGWIKQTQDKKILFSWKWDYWFNCGPFLILICSLKTCTQSLLSCTNHIIQYAWSLKWREYCLQQRLISHEPFLPSSNLHYGTSCVLNHSIKAFRLRQICHDIIILSQQHQQITCPTQQMRPVQHTVPHHHRVCHSVSALVSMEKY